MSNPNSVRVDYPRDLAVRILTRVLSGGEALDEVLASISGEVSGGARAWLQDVCSGTLRWKGRLDLAVDSAALKKRPTGWLRKILLVAAYQLIGQERVQPASVVMETVDLVRRQEGEAPAKFANAILRKISEHAVSWRELPFPARATDGEQAQWASLPEWMWKRLLKGRGFEWTKAYALTSLTRPKTWVRAREAEVLGSWTQAGPVPGSFSVEEGGPIFEKPGFVEGKFLVQDISSQSLIYDVAAKIRKDLGSERALRVLDLCAAPGGKSVGLSWSGFDVYASDVEASRYALLKQTVERLAPEVKVIAREEVSALHGLNAVWVDAPCSGSGILRRHPDVRWLKREEDLVKLRATQLELLGEARRLMKSGGYLVFSTCSVLPEEGASLVRDFMGSPEGQGLKSCGEWFLEPQTAPYGDGFYCQLLS